MSRDSDGLDQGLVETRGNSDAMADSFVKRFVVLKHDVGPQFERTTESHLDWMFEAGEALSTWSTDLRTQFENSFDTGCFKLSDHRLVYLDREGDLGGGRGSVLRILAGEFTQVASVLPDVTFKAVLRWQTDSGVRYARIEISQRPAGKDSKSDPVCALRFSIG